ncbi:MAG: hypothetical protein QXZ43_04495 [Candidatus Aenigmatarchaeota archaeon]
MKENPLKEIPIKLKQRDYDDVLKYLEQLEKFYKHLSGYKFRSIKLEIVRRIYLFAYPRIRDKIYKKIIEGYLSEAERMPHMYESALKVFLLLDDLKRDKFKELLLQAYLGFLVTQVKRITNSGDTEKNRSYLDLIELYSQKLGLKPEDLPDYTKNRNLIILENLKKNVQN